MIKDICYATDDNYAHLVGISIISLVKNNEIIRDNLTFHIICIDITKDNIDRLDSLQDLLGVKIELYMADLKKYIQRKGEKRLWPIATYARLFLSEILDDSIDEVLYMDCDTMVVNDIKPILDIVLDSNFAIAGCKDTFGDEAADNIELPKKYTYINAGILCISLKKWRALNLTEIVLKAYNSLEEEPKFCDQDIINWDLRDYVKPTIPYEYNAQGLDCFYPESLQKKSICIIHYLSYEYRSRRKDLMQLLKTYYSESPWEGMPIKDERSIYFKIRSRVKYWMWLDCRALYNVITPIWNIFRIMIRGNK